MLAAATTASASVWHTITRTDDVPFSFLVASIVVVRFTKRVFLLLLLLFYYYLFSPDIIASHQQAARHDQ